MHCVCAMQNYSNSADLHQMSIWVLKEHYLYYQVLWIQFYSDLFLLNTCFHFSLYIQSVSQFRHVTHQILSFSPKLLVTNSQLLAPGLESSIWWVLQRIKYQVTYLFYITSQISFNSGRVILFFKLFLAFCQQFIFPSQCWIQISSRSKPRNFMEKHMGSKEAIARWESWWRHFP